MKITIITGPPGGGKSTKASEIVNKRVSVWADIFYDWRKEIVGNKESIKVLVFDEIGVPTPQSIERIAEIIKTESIKVRAPYAREKTEIQIHELIFICQIIPDQLLSTLNANDFSFEVIYVDQKNAFLEAAKPLMKYLAENHNPHTSAIIESNRAQLVQGIKSEKTDEFIVD